MSYCHLDYKAADAIRTAETVEIAAEAVLENMPGTVFIDECRELAGELWPHRQQNYFTMQAARRCYLTRVGWNKENRNA